ncbi:MAG: AAA family ATPase [Gemmatimonadota bacterium]
MNDLRLVRLHAAGFGRLRDFTLEPAREPGALIVAPNEAGKSTVAAALFHGLFGFPDKALEALRRPWSGPPFALTLEWSLGDDQTCTIARDFETQRVTVEWRTRGALEHRWEGEPNPRGRSSDRAGYDLELKRLLGFAAPDIFRQTAFVDPGDAAVKPLAAELLRLLSGSERADFRTALIEFEAGYYHLTQFDIAGGGRAAKQKPRQIEELAARRDAAAAALEAARGARDARRERERALGDVQNRLAAIDRELTDRGASQEAIRRMSRLRQELAGAQARQAELDAGIERFAEWERQVRDRTGALEPYVRYLRLPEDFSQRVHRLQQLELERARVAETVREAGPGNEGSPEVMSWVALVGLLVAAGGGLWLALGGAPLAAGGVLALGLAIAGGGVLQWRARRAARRRREVRRGAQQAELARYDQERRELAKPLPFDPDTVELDAELASYRRAQTLRSELDGMQATHHALGDRAALERERRALKEGRLDILRLEQRQLLEQYPWLDWGPDYERQFAAEQQRLHAERERLSTAELAHRRAVADLRGPDDDPTRLAASIAACDAEAERLALDRDAFQMAHATLTACKDEFVRMMTQRLERRIGRIFAALTEDRYTEAEIDPATLLLTVHGREKRGVPAEALSRGTRDQLYFALRVALLEELAANRSLPIVLDDPFLHFDRKRLTQVERTLAQLGATHQILLLTHDTRLADWTFPKQWLPDLTGHVVAASSSP